MRLLKRILIIALMFVVLAFGVLFSIQNTSLAPLDLLVVQLPAQRLSLWVLLAFAVGGACGMLISTAAIVRLKSRALMLQRQLNKASKVAPKPLKAEVLPVVAKAK